MREELKKLALIVAVFLACFYLPAGSPVFDRALNKALQLVRWYAREHVLLCLVPAFFIAGGIAVFVSQASVTRYLGARANKVLAYGVASASGTILAVCSCTVLPLFAGIYRMGAGLGPATAFLYSGPAINVLAIILTARVLGLKIGVARAVGAVGLSVVIGLCMHLIYRREEVAKAEAQGQFPEARPSRALWQNALFFAGLVGILVFANWGRPGGVGGVFAAVYSVKWILSAAALTLLAIVLALWFTRQDLGEWTGATWTFAKQILPLLLAGVLVSGFFLGRPGEEGLIPSRYIQMLVGERPEGFLSATGLAGGAADGLVRSVWPVWTCLFASISGAVMYFATLTEVPILQGLMGSGMGEGPALSLLLAGPAVSLPSMLVIRQVVGTGKMLVYVSLVVVFSTLAGVVFAWI